MQKKWLNTGNLKEVRYGGEELMIESSHGPKTGSKVIKNVVGTMSLGVEVGRILSTVFRRICREIGAKSDS